MIEVASNIFVLKLFFKRFQQYLLAICILVLVGNISLFAKNEQTKLDTVSIQLRNYHQFQFAGFYVAQAKGFYKDIGLYVKTLELNTETIPHSISLDKTEFGVSGSCLIKRKLNGESIILLKAIYQHSPLVILTLKKNNINIPSDLVGKRIMTHGQQLDFNILSLFKSESITLEQVLLVQHSFNFDDLLSGKVDAITGSITTQPFYFKTKGFESNSINPFDYGIDFYGDMLFTSEEEVKNHPERTKAFVEASINGWKYAYENIEETVDIILSLQSIRPYKLTKEMLLSEAEISKKYVLPDILEIGHINSKRIKKIADIYKEFESFDRISNLDGFIYEPISNTNSFFDNLILFGFLITTVLAIISFGMVFRLRHRLKVKARNMWSEFIEKRVAREVLEKKEKRNSALLNIIPDLIFRLKSDGTYISANIPMGSNLGIVEHKLIGKNIVEVMPAEVAPLAQVSITKSLTTKKIQCLRYKMPHNGIDLDFEARITPAGNDEVLVIVRDITEIVRKTNRLKKSEEKFSKIFHNSPDSIVLTGVDDSIILDCNQSFLKTTGFTMSEVIGKTPEELNLWVNTNDRKIFLDSLYDQNKVSGVRFDFRNKNGDVINCLVSAEIITISNKNIILGTYQNITELIEKETRLKETQLNFSKVFKSSPIAISITSLKEGKIVDINSEGEKLLNMSKKDVIGKTSLEINFWKTKKERDFYVNLLSKEGQVKNFEISFNRNNGDIVPCSISSEIIVTNKEKFIIGSLLDLSLIKKNEQELTEALKDVKELKSKLQKENVLLQQEINANYNIGNIITNSSQVRNELQKIQQVAITSSTVLILGETGTGKELFARTIHSLSNRADKPLVKINCAALPSNLIESELFGHEKGAFTGAVRQHIGRFELANKATIFLDEIGELPVEIQAKLLRVLQEGEFERVGSCTTIKTDARVIAASNRDLQKMILEGSFRKDLFYRLNVFPLTTVPLRERPEDIEPLVNFFIKQISTKIGKKIKSIDKTSFDLLMNYSFPGNIRELESIIERAIITTNNSILLLDIPREKNEKNFTKKTILEKDMIIEALNSSNWKIEGSQGAAKKIGLPPSTLRDKIKKYQLTNPQ